MSTCKITNGLDAKLCRDTVPGVRRFFVTNWENVESFTYDGEDGSISGITMSGTQSHFYEYRPNKDGGNYDINIQPTADNGGVTYEHSATMIFSKNEQDTINTIKILARANLIIIVENRKGDYILLGKNEGLQLNEGLYQSGQGGTDENNWTLTFTGNDFEPQFIVASTVIPSILET